MNRKPPESNRSILHPGDEWTDQGVLIALTVKIISALRMKTNSGKRS